MQSLEPNKTLGEKAYEAILDALCDGTFAPGERLTQEVIAGRLNVSRQPVTHALAVLRDQGFVSAHERQGVVVKAVDTRFFREIYELRSVIEPLAVRLATPRFGEREIRKAKALIAAGQRCLDEGDSDGALNADMEFHGLIHDTSGNHLISRTMDLHRNYLRFGMRQVLRSPGMSHAVWKEHAEVLEHMLSGDADAAAEAMRRHLVDAYERMSARRAAAPAATRDGGAREA